MAKTPGVSDSPEHPISLFRVLRGMRAGVPLKGNLRGVGAEALLADPVPAVVGVRYVGRPDPSTVIALPNNVQVMLKI